MVVNYKCLTASQPVNFLKRGDVAHAGEPCLSLRDCLFVRRGNAYDFEKRDRD